MPTATSSVQARVSHLDIMLPNMAKRLSLEQTLDCGQAFRWVRLADGSFEGVALGKLLRVGERDGDIVLYNTTMSDFENFWLGYFDLERDYDAIKLRLSNDPTLRDAIGYAPGIRILSQDPWETLCTFIISANNNIPRIKGIVGRLCELLGDRVGDGHYAFPPAERLAALCEDDLVSLRCGYRAGYLLDAARRVSDGRLNLCDTEQLTTSELRRRLLEVLGVGPKVADCVLLFGFGRVECFPIDRWINKVMAVLYPQGLPNGFEEVAGIAQQYLFHYARNHPELFA